jgi:hypothetical protein
MPVNIGGEEHVSNYRNTDAEFFITDYMVGGSRLCYLYSTRSTRRSGPRREYHHEDGWILEDPEVEVVYGRIVCRFILSLQPEALTVVQVFQLDFYKYHFSFQLDLHIRRVLRSDKLPSLALW